MGFTLRQLQVFVAVARLGSVVKAADYLCMTQAAASSSLSQLESHLGVTLFLRKGKRLLLNEHGQWLLPKANELLDQALSISRGVCELDPMAGKLRIAASQTIAQFLLPEWLKRYHRQYPQVDLEVMESNTQQVQHLVEQGEVDLGLVEGAICSATLEQTKWLTDELVITCAADHPWANQQVTLAMLNDAEWIMREPGSGTRSLFESAAHKAGITLTIRQQLSHSPSLIALLESGRALGCLSRYLVDKELKERRLAKIYSPLQLTRQFILLGDPQRHLSSPAKAWYELLGLALPNH